MATQTIASGWTIDGATVTATGNSIAINLGNANTWTNSQTFEGTASSPSIKIFGATGILATEYTNGNGHGYDRFGNFTFGGDTSGSYAINQTISSATHLFSVSYLGVVATSNNTLDDDTGNIIAKLVVSGTGFKTTAGAATTVTVGASPYTYSNTSSSNQQLFIQGGTVSAIAFNPNGGTGISLSGLTDNVLVVRPGDTVTVTYTAAPTMTTIQL